MLLKLPFRPLNSVSFGGVDKKSIKLEIDAGSDDSKKRKKVGRIFFIFFILVSRNVSTAKKHSSLDP